MTRRLNKKHWPYIIEVAAADDQQSRETWLTTHLGKFRDGWFAVYQHNSTEYYFRDHRDAVMFTLRWS